MKITDIKIQVIKRDKSEFPDLGNTVRKDKAGFMDVEVQGKKSSHIRRTNDEFPLLTIITDEGIEGISFGTDGMRQAHYLADMKALLLDEDPLYPEKIWQKLWLITGRAPRLPQTLLGTVDIAIWDIVGKAAKLPLYKILGGYRDKVPAYASLSHW
ncbi:MAG: hypothetical protein NTV30_07825 [Chloroflexi bacterium]|nr:hypothetical protein [Chloroflexota bacterium]